MCSFLVHSPTNSGSGFLSFHEIAEWRVEMMVLVRYIIYQPPSSNFAWINSVLFLGKRTPWVGPQAGLFLSRNQKLTCQFTELVLLLHHDTSAESATLCSLFFRMIYIRLLLAVGWSIEKRRHTVHIRKPRNCIEPWHRLVESIWINPSSDVVASGVHPPLLSVAAHGDDGRVAWWTWSKVKDFCQKMTHDSQD